MNPKNRPAYPTPSNNPNPLPEMNHDLWQNGMSLRDYFAAKAIRMVWDNKQHLSDLSKRAYQIADAMLKAREQ